MKRRRRLWKSGHMSKMKSVWLAWLWLCTCAPAAVQQQQQQTPVQPRRPSFLEAGRQHASLVVGSSWQQELLLPCKILHLDEQQTVSWIRLRDSLVLSVGQLMLGPDPRFRLARAGHWAPGSAAEAQQAAPEADDWSLVLSEPRQDDAGAYECQVPSVEPKLSRTVELRLVQADSYINAPNQSSLVVRPNQRVRLTCHIRAPQQTRFLYWYRNQQPIQYQRLEGRSGGPAGQEVGAGAQQSTNSNLVASSSTLVVQHSQLNESANFTCLPSNAKPSQISVFVIESGPQSQPEKRSLQASSGAPASRRPSGARAYFLSWKQLLQGLLALEVAATVAGLILNYPRAPVH